jgi:prepilin-type N-terminal cleavage/methylation domain-containing protein
MFSLVRHKSQVPHSHEDGFTMIEVMVALAIFVIGILGCYQLQLRSTQTNALANSVGTAATWATYAVEQVLAKDYDDLDLKDDGTGGAGNAGLNDTEGAADGVLSINPDGSTSPGVVANALYTVSWNVSEGASADALAGTKLVRYIVIKKGGIGQGTLYTHDYYKTSDIL